MAQTFGDRWRVLRQIDQGGQGHVFEVQDLRGEVVGPSALKRINNVNRRPRFVQEVLAVKKLRHQGVVPVIDHSPLNSVDGPMFLVMPLLGGGNLARRAKLYAGNVDSTIRVAAAIADALAAAHGAGVIHRDVKPANLLFEAADGHDVRLGDFGICLARDAPRETDTGEAMGPRGFMAPELEGGGRIDVSPSVDLYSLGKVIYFMLSGGVVVPREEHRSSRYDLFQATGFRMQLLGALLDRLICHVERRATSAAEVRDELHRIEAWDRNFGSALLSPRSVEVSAAMTKQARDAIDVQEHNRRVREASRSAVARCQTLFQTWAMDALQATARQLNVDGLLVAEARAADLEEPLRIQIDRGGKYMESLGGVSLLISRPTSHAAVHRLDILLFQQHRITITVGDQVPRLNDVSPTLVVVPVYWWQGRTPGFLSSLAARARAAAAARGNRHVRGNTDVVSRTFHGGQWTLSYQVSADEFASKLGEIALVTTEAIETSLEYIKAGASSLGA